jgi:hypothetical protein
MRCLRLLLAVTVLSCFGCDTVLSLFEKHRQPARYLLPQGFTGWAVVEYGVVGAPPTPLEDGFLLYRFPASGKIQSSSSQENGWATDEYYYSDPTGKNTRLPFTGLGKGGMIWAPRSGGKGASGSTYGAFFVGTESELSSVKAYSHPTE